MTTILVAVPQPRAAALAAELELEGATVATIVSPRALLPLPTGIDAIIVPASRAVLSVELLAACDRAGVRLLPLGEGDTRWSTRYGLASPLPAEAPGWTVLEALGARPHLPTAAPSAPSRIITVWGSAGSPGRSMLALHLAVELARHERRTAIVDADTVSPSVALMLGLDDDAPGVAAACRRAELGSLDAAELTRLAAEVPTSGGVLRVLAGINRPSRWPEISDGRLRATLQACRVWSDEIVVDVASSTEADEEATYDLSGPRRHAATTAALQEADLVIALASADPLGISRFLRDHSEISRLTGSTPVRVVVNKVRPGPLGIDPRGQVRRTLERFAGITDVTFLPFDLRSTDAALLHARPISDLAPRSAYQAAVRRLAESISPAGAGVTGGSSRGNSRGARRPRRALWAPAASPDADGRGSAS